VWATEYGWPGGGHVLEAQPWLAGLAVAFLYSWEADA
jgi:hypothetical protein